MYCIPHLCYIIWPKIVTVLVKSWGLQVGPGCLVPGLGDQGCSDRSLWPFLFSLHLEIAHSRNLLFLFKLLAWFRSPRNYSFLAKPGNLQGKLHKYLSAARPVEVGGAGLMLSSTISSLHRHSLHSAPAECSASAKWLQPAGEEAENLQHRGAAVPVPEFFSSCHCQHSCHHQERERPYPVSWSKELERHWIFWTPDFLFVLSLFPVGCFLGGVQ